MSIKIVSLEIESFRGISLPCKIDFVKNGKPCNTLIVGDNGSGKSSIIDALDFITRRKMPEKVIASNKFSNKVSKIKMILSDNKEYECEIKKTIHTNIIYFEKVPFIIRRKDILQFWDTPDNQKQALFYEYLLEAENFLEKLKLLEKRKTKLMQLKRELTYRITKEAKLSYQDIPLWSTHIDQFYNCFRRNKIEISQNLKDVVEKRIDCNKNLEFIDAEINKYSPATIIKNRFKELSESITKTFLELTTMKNEIDKIDLAIGEETEGLNFKITLKNHNKANPEFFLSEANIDMLAFVIRIELIKKAVEFGQAPILVLDDVFQSIDSGVRLKIVEHIIKNLRDWQIIITVHDRLWKEQLYELFKKNNVDLAIYEITKWNGKEGSIIHSDSMALNDTLRKNINKGSINEIMSNTSILLEKICFELSWRLEIAVIKKKDDKYTLGDLWPGLHKELKKTNLNDISTKVNGMLYLRNMMGGHYNEWSLSLSRKESVEFAEAILVLYDNIYCQECGHWIEKATQKEKYIGIVCKCGKLNVQQP